MMIKEAFFLGTKKRRRYFEGWYFKCISADRQHAIAFIPGMSIDRKGNKHSFVQIINATSGKTWYHSFAFSEFQAKTKEFKVNIGENVFGSKGLKVNIPSDSGGVEGELTFFDIKLFPSGKKNPGIMGPYTDIPLMECYHAIIHLAHKISGKIELDGEVLDFDGGVGYIEKDYGRSFPESYVWIQGGHFDENDACFVFSRAKIPFLGSHFTGFFAYFTDFKGLTHRFATYNRSKVVQWEVDKEKGYCSGKLKNADVTLEFKARMDGGGRLRAPVDGKMEREIIESIRADVYLRLKSSDGQVLFEGNSDQAGMEISL